MCCFFWQGLCQCCLCCFELSLCCLYYVVCICVALVHVVSSDKVYVSIVCFILVCVVCCDKVYFHFLCCCWSVLSYWLSLFWCCLLHFGLCCLNWLNLCCCLCKLSLSIVLIRTLLFLLFVISVNIVRNYMVYVVYVCLLIFVVVCMDKIYIVGHLVIFAFIYYMLSYV